VSRHLSEEDDTMMKLDRASLHGSLHDPVLGSMERVKAIAERYPGAISFGLGAPRPGPSGEPDISFYVERYLAHLRRERGLDERQARRLLYDYGPSRGLINDLVADALWTDEGIGTSAESVVITVGAQEALLLALRAVCRTSEDLVGVVDPSYYGVLGAARLLGLRTAGLRETADGVDVEDLALRCGQARRRGERIRVVYVVPDFSNPSGTVMSLPVRRRLLRLADREDLLVIEDGTYGFTAEPGRHLPSLKSMDSSGRVIYVGTFAKICLPGARVGFVVADQRAGGEDGPRLLADEIALLKSVTTVNTPPVCQALIGGMLLEHGGSAAAIGAATAPVYRRNLGVLLDALAEHLPSSGGVTWNRPDGGFFVQLRLPVPADDALLELSARRYGVLWTPLASIYLDEAGSHCIRLSCASLDPAAIRDGAERLGRFLRDACVPRPRPGERDREPLPGRPA
jgi:(S)-3,5-dihydroxyphenylglycine transaminase